MAITGAATSAATWLGNTAPYGTASEWDTGIVPAVTDEVIINSGLATNTGNLTRNGTTTISGTGTLSIQNGRFISGGTVNVSASGTIEQTGNYFLVGNTSRGTLNQSGGTVNATVDRGFFLSDTAAQGGSSYNLTGGTLNVTNFGSGSDVGLFAVHIGKGGTGDTFTIDGGTATFTAITASRNVWLSRSASFQVFSGSASFSGYESFTIGRFGSINGTSQLVMSGGSFSVSNLTNSFTLGQIDNGQAILTGGTMDIGASVLLGGAPDVSGSFMMSGGKLTAWDILAGTGNALFAFDGGEIFLSGDRTSLLTEPWFNAVIGTTAVYDAGLNQTHVFVVPEPSTLSLLGVPFVLGMMRRRRSGN